MHSYHWWTARPAGAGFAWGGCGPDAAAWGWERFATMAESFADIGGGAFGVRRPLRFLAFKLELSEEQVAELAKVLNGLKTERAQAGVDWRRTMTAFADAVAGETFGEARAAEGAGLRVDSATRLRDAVVAALRRMHAILDPEQRSHLAYLIRTGRLTL